MDKRFLAILAGIIIVFLGIFMFTRDSGKDKSGGDGGAEATSHISGEGQTGVTLMEYGDYQCPVCAAYYGPLKEATDKYSKEIFFQFRNLPLTSIHPNAFAASRAAEAAGLQNKYFEMHSKLYQNQSAWAGSSSPLRLFKTYAQSLNLDVAKFEKDYASSAVNDAINADLDAFSKTGRPQSTPSFFMNGEPIENTEFADPQTGAPSVERISAAIDKAIAEKKKPAGN